VRRALTLLAGAGLLLTGCTSTVVGTASPGTGAAGCEWQELEGGRSHVVEVDVPSDVPTDGTTDLTLTTGVGTVTLTLDHEAAPCAAASLVSLAEQGFFDGSTCHRETDVPGLQVLQCGDPTGTGSGGPSYRYPTQVDGDETYERGTVAMANAADGYDGSQFFLVWGDSELPPSYTVVGRVDDAGLAVLDDVAAAGNDGSNGPGDGAPNTPVEIGTATVG
jgi:peptidyl-prolyl cis-trans isomerase B (cyclophilin B)